MSNRLHDILSQEADKMAVIQNVTEERRKELKAEDDEEDYLDECMLLCRTCIICVQVITVKLHLQYFRDADSFIR